MLSRRYKFLGSSQDPDKVSLTIKSLLPLVILLVATFKIDIDNTQIETLALTIASIINGCITIYGILRKFLTK